MNETPPPQPPEPRADWLAWSFHLLFGLFIGAVMGLLFAFRMRHLDLIAFNQVHLITIGISLFAGAITSYRGNRAWFRPSIFDPEQPAQSQTSRNTSLLIGGLGILLCLGAVIHHLSNAAPTHRPVFSGIHIFLLLFAAVPGFLAVHSLRKGTLYSRFGPIERDQSPLLFWSSVASLILAVIYVFVTIFR